MSACACGEACRCEALLKAIREASEALRAGMPDIAEQILSRAIGAKS